MYFSPWCQVVTSLDAFKSRHQRIKSIIDSPKVATVTRIASSYAPPGVSPYSQYFPGDNIPVGPGCYFLVNTPDCNPDESYFSVSYVGINTDVYGCCDYLNFGFLPVTFTGYRAILDGAFIRIQWEAVDVEAVEVFNLYWAPDATNWEKIFEAAPNGEYYEVIFPAPPGDSYFYLEAWEASGGDVTEVFTPGTTFVKEPHRGPVAKFSGYFDLMGPAFYVNANRNVKEI